MNDSVRWLLAVLALAAVASTGVANAAVPAGRYTYPAPGTVYDTKTKLTWQQTAPSATYSWTQALTYCAGVGKTLGGAGWRLPTVKELQTLVDESRSSPSIDPTAFPGAPSTTFWTSSNPFKTTAAASATPSQVWIVSFIDGTGNRAPPTPPTLTFDVRCVR